MIDVVGAERGAREAIQQIVFFVGGVIRANHADGRGAVHVAHLFEAARNFFERVFPTRRFEFAVAANERLADSFRIVREIEAEAAFAAEELAIDAGMVAIIGAEDFIVANAERGLASVRAVRARLGNVGHFPRARLVAVGSAGERADRADINAHAAFFAGQRAFFIRQDYGMHAAGADAESFHVHALIADAYAAEAENAARRVIKNERRPLFFRVVELFFGEAAVVEAVAKRHVLQFAFAALVADGAIERMIREQKLEHVLARFVNLRGVGLHHHAFDGDESAGGLKLRALFQLRRGTCGRRPGAQAQGNSRTRGLRCPGAWPLRSRACPQRWSPFDR